MKAFFPVMDCLADFLGDTSEVVLHDLTRDDKSIVKIRNGHVTGRKEGGPLTDVALKMIKDAGEGRDIIGTYYPLTMDGRLLKSNATVIRDINGKIIGILCINLDVRPLQVLQAELRGMSARIEDLLKGSTAFIPSSIQNENFGNSPIIMLEDTIRETILKKGKNSESLSMEDKLDIIGSLEDKGVFYMKKAVVLTSEALNVSPPSIYRYMDLIRRKKSVAGKPLAKNRADLGRK